ncbi:hypothetical protein AHF37_02441 [Paragonimus kellicotti]|nr:hypothetical protein AHF37_02441 [Paragonimus kellicotti]
MFSDAFTRDLQLFSADPCRNTYLAAALLMRGSVTASDIRRNIEKLQQRLRFVPWNREGWKVGHCLVPPIGLPYSLLALSNNTAIRERFSDILERFSMLYKRKMNVTALVMAHHGATYGLHAAVFPGFKHRKPHRRAFTPLAGKWNQLLLQAAEERWVQLLDFLQ